MRMLDGVRGRAGASPGHYADNGIGGGWTEGRRAAVVGCGGEVPPDRPLGGPDPWRARDWPGRGGCHRDWGAAGTGNGPC